VIFVAITASFYSALAAHVPGLDPSDPAVRSAIVPLNPPKPGTPAVEVAAAKVASVDAFHLAAMVSAGLMIAGSATSWFGLRAATGRVSRSGAATKSSKGPPSETVAAGPG